MNPPEDFSPRHRFWWLPNTLTMARVVMAPAVLVLLVIGWLAAGDEALRSGWTAAAGVLLLVAGVFDFLDGKLARVWGAESAFGQRWDPLADKAIAGAALIGLSLVAPLIWIPAIAIIARDAGVTWMRRAAPRAAAIAKPSMLAKIKTALEFFGLIAVANHGLLGGLVDLVWPFAALGVIGSVVSVGVGVAALYVAAALSVWTGVRYARIALRPT